MPRQLVLRVQFNQDRLEEVAATFRNESAMRVDEERQRAGFVHVSDALNIITGARRHIGKLYREIRQVL